MKEFPIVIPPKQNMEAEIVHVKASRGNVEFFQKKSVAKVMASLTPTQRDAAMEICLAPQVYQNPGKYRAFGYGRVAGMSPDELSAYMLDVKARYEEWRKRMASEKPIRIIMKNGRPLFVIAQKALNICLGICQEEKSVDALAKNENIGHETALKILQAGLNEYAIHAGWQFPRDGESGL